MKFKKASLLDLTAILQLLNENQLPVQDVHDHIYNFFVIKEGHVVVGCIGLEKYQRVALLRSLVVRKEKRSLGLGKMLTEKLLDFARNKKIKRVYLLTTTAAPFFKKFGFRQIDREEADPVIQQTSEFVELCPCSAVLMVKNLN